jgi:hypothetical protein
MALYAQEKQDEQDLRPNWLVEPQSAVTVLSLIHDRFGSSEIKKMHNIATSLQVQAESIDRERHH